jgi:hypothetical protein
MSSSKKLTCKRDFAAGVYLSEAQNPIHCIRVYRILRKGGSGGEWNQREV